MKGRTSEWFGLLNLNKPAGWSSRKAVDCVKRFVRPAKIGHAGTLDPLATGVLVLCFGQATRLVPYLHELTKTYHAEFLFGCTSPTDDTEVDVATLPDPPELTLSQIEAVLPRFVGKIEQVPPAYSAVKLNGRRAYELARRGKTPDIRPRTVHVTAIRILKWDAPRLRLEIVCGSGTYIRSIGRDLAQELGSGAVMSALTRTCIGPFRLDHAIDPAQITRESLPTLISPAQAALVGMPHLTASREMLERLQRGLCCEHPSQCVENDRELAVLDETDRLILIARIVDGGRALKPSQVFSPKSGRI